MRLGLSIRSAVEGDLVFNNEPVMQIEGPLVQGQLVETAILNIINYQILIATKAARIRSAAGSDPLLEFGSRRAQEMDAALWGTRAAYIGGFDATSNVRAAKIFDIPASGTHAHSLIQTYRNDYEGMMAYARTHHDCVFLVDTYDTLRSGVPSAIRVAKEMGDKISFQGVRIDSGDMAYISKRVRQQLDEAGFDQAKIYASNDLDEKTIQNLKMQGAKIDVWGVGTRVITAYDQPALGAVYKLVSIESDDGSMVDTIKLSSNAEKVSTPGKKQVWRITDTKDGKSEGDYVAVSMKIRLHNLSCTCSTLTTLISIRRCTTLLHAQYYRISLTTASWCMNYQICTRFVLTRPATWTRFGTNTSGISTHRNTRLTFRKSCMTTRWTTFSKSVQR